MAIHSTAVIDPGADLAPDVEVGAYAVIEKNVQVSEGCQVGPFAVLREYTILGPRCTVDAGAVLGGLPQDAKFKGERSYLRLGADNQVREFVTLHRASGEEASTVIGDSCMIMAYAHAGHNCTIGDEVLIANSVALSGHCTIEDYVTIGGLAALHQYTSVGTMAMIGGLSRIVRDCPPYMIVEGNPAKPRGVNLRGLMRRGVSEAARDSLRRAYRMLFRSRHNISDAIAQILAQEPDPGPELLHLIEFMRGMDQGSRGRQRNP
ncbi:MAG: acyl-ACP--UDP-N-acetylglucosamine O-acyltransferase [candidate division WS1 bacterium]|nr:acyl-ACP--UDP-N-acetylglucosamine O-acyltransferase [candidate division WS1 bacterium]